MKKLSVFVVALLGFGMSSYAQSVDRSCNQLLDEYRVLVDSVILIAKEYHSNPNSKDSRNSRRFISAKIEMNKWYGRWNEAICKEEGTYVQTLNALEEKKNQVIKEHYSMTY
ncbi:MAG: hypothetical protein IPO21_08855 [Bacteroidales bacterium]|nr:hypothetical protein [Bacteroidales bacterium]